MDLSVLKKENVQDNFFSGFLTPKLETKFIFALLATTGYKIL